MTAEAQADADAALQQLIKGELVIYSGALQTNQGKALLADGESYPQQALELETMDWLVEGVKGSIDG